MKKSVLILFIGFVAIFTIAFTISSYCFVGGCGSDYITRLVLLRKKLVRIIYPSNRLNYDQYLKRSASYKDQDGNLVNIFGGPFNRIDLKEHIMWLEGFNNKSYGFRVADGVTSPLIKYVDINGDNIEIQQLTLNTLANDNLNIINKGDYVYVYWRSSDTESSNVQPISALDDNIVNNYTGTVFEIDRNMNYPKE